MNWDQSVDYFHPLKKLELWFHKKKINLTEIYENMTGEKAEQEIP